MKKFSMATIIVGLFLIVMSLAIVRFDGGSSLWDRFTEADNVDYTAEEKELDAVGVKKISADLSSVGIVVRPDASADKIKIDYFQNVVTQFNAEIRDGSLNITEISRRPWWKMFDFQSWQTRSVVIHVPSNLIADYDLRTDNGRVELSGLTTERLDIRTSNGEIDLGELRASVVGARTSNGRITFGRLESDDITLSTSNGEISGLIVGHEADFRKNLRTSLGQIVVGNASFRGEVTSGQGDKSLTATTSNGAIRLNFTQQ